MAKAKILPRDSDLYAVLVGFQDVDVDPPSFPQNATVTCTIVDAAEAPVANGTDVPMPYVTGTASEETEYRGVIPASVALLKNTPYTGKIVATLPGGAKHTFRVDFQAGA
jgi:hypothetical protein